MCLNIRQRGIDTAFLLRNNLTRVGCEMWIKVYSPNVQGVEIVKRAEKRKKRARLTYMRYDFLSTKAQDDGFAYDLFTIKTTQARFRIRGRCCSEIPSREGYSERCGRFQEEEKINDNHAIEVGGFTEEARPLEAFFTCIDCVYYFHCQILWRKGGGKITNSCFGSCSLNRLSGSAQRNRLLTRSCQNPA